MALTAITASCVTVVTAFEFGGQSGKKRIRKHVTIHDPAATSGGIVVGANQADIPASAFGLTKIESCGSLLVYTTSTGAPVRIYPAAADLAGTSILLGNQATDTDTEAARMAVADVTIATTESAKIEVIGYR